MWQSYEMVKLLASLLKLAWLACLCSEAASFAVRAHRDSLSVRRNFGTVKLAKLLVSLLELTLQLSFRNDSLP